MLFEGVMFNMKVYVVGRFGKRCLIVTKECGMVMGYVCRAELVVVCSVQEANVFASKLSGA